jgi:hypothetical protein
MRTGSQYRQLPSDILCLKITSNEISQSLAATHRESLRVIVPTAQQIKIIQKYPIMVKPCLSPATPLPFIPHWCELPELKGSCTFRTMCNAMKHMR